MKTDPNTIAELRALLEKAPGPSMWQMLPRPFPPRQSEDDTALADAAVNALPDLLDDVEENARLRAEVEALRRKPVPPTDEQPIPPLVVVRALSAPAYEDVLSDEERAACATIAAELEALRDVERLVRECNCCVCWRASYRAEPQT